MRFDCDGCGGQAATIDYVSPRAEFTPPVIYSRGNRERMVFLVEARPERPARSWRPGQPVDVIDVRGLTKRFGDRVVVDHLDMQVAARHASTASWAPTAAARPPPSACCAAC
jgi:hypothetical protein